MKSICIMGYVTLAWCLSWSTGCRVDMGGVQKKLDAMDYRGAVDRVRGDREKERHLAAELIAREAHANPAKSRRLLLALNRGASAGKRTLKRLADSHPDTPVGNMAFLLEQPSSYRVRKKAVELAQHESGDVRAVAATRYAMTFDVAFLLTRVEDINPVVRGASTAALCRFMSEEAVREAVVTRLRVDPILHVRIAAMTCVGQLDPDDALSHLEAYWQRESSSKGREACVAQLAQLGTDEAIASLQHKTHGVLTPLKVRAIVHLVLLEAPGAMARFENALVDDNPTVRAEAIRQLHRVFVDIPVTILEAALNDAPKVAVEAGAQLLHRVSGHDDAVATLLSLWKDDGVVAERAFDILVEARVPQAVETARQQILDVQHREIVGVLIDRFSSSPRLYPVFVDLMGAARRTTRVTAARAVLSQETLP